MGTQHHIFIDIERVLHIPRGVILRQVEQGEVVVVQLDLRAVEHRKSHADQRIANQAIRLRHRVQAAQRVCQLTGGCDVQRFLGKAAKFCCLAQGCALLGNDRFQRRLDLVGKSADAGALAAFELTHRAQNCRQRSVSAEHVDQKLLQLFG